MPQTSPGVADLRSFSCLICRQRKIKCDRHNPCFNCRKAAKQCSFVPPVRGKPKKRKAHKEGLHAKLRRYEEMLKSYGAKIEPSDDDTNTISDAEISVSDIEMVDNCGLLHKSSGSPFTFDENKTRLVTKNGSSRYFDTGIWSNLEDDVHHPEGQNLSETLEGSNVRGSDLFLDACEDNGLVLNAVSRIENLASLHQSFDISQKLYDIYAERVDPLMKFLHLPTFRSMLKSASQTPHDISKSLEALIFTFYLVTIMSLEDDECYSLLGEKKSTLSARYKPAARQALINAGFIQTHSLMTLQAYAIFLMGMRGHYDFDSLFILSGIAVRLGRRMGLHRDGTLLGLSPFETEMRRRLWWHIVHIDFRTCEFSGTKSSTDISLGDAKMPLNVEDDDLSPDMTELPPERTGITSVVLCLIRCDVVDFPRKVTPPFSPDIHWDYLASTGITPAEKDKIINQMEDALETKYLRHYDPSNSLHCFASIIIRSSICKMKLFAHKPRQFASCGVKVPSRSRDIIFESGMKSLEYASLIYSNEGLRKYTWQLKATFLWDTLFYVLIEARHRKIGPEVDRVWQAIGSVFTNQPQILEETTEALYNALANWTLQVWAECADARKVEGLPELPTPDYITAIRRHRRVSSATNGRTDAGRVIGNSTGYSETQPLRHDGNQIIDPEAVESYDFSNLLSFDLEPNEWVQWERLLAGQAI